MNRIKKNNLRTKKRALRTRAKLFGTSLRPRLSVFRSNRYTYAQAVDDNLGKTLIAASTKELKNKDNKSLQASLLGELVAEKAKKAGIKTMIFDKGAYKYHGRVKNVAEALRTSGIKI